MKPFFRTFQTLLLVLVLAETASGVMPPDHYAEMSERSKIKATALVLSVEILETTKEHTMKRVSFFLRHPFSDGVPDHFSGICFPLTGPGRALWREAPSTFILKLETKYTLRWHPMAEE